MKTSEFIKQAARGDQLSNWLIICITTDLPGPYLAPARKVIGFFGDNGRTPGAHRSFFNGSLSRMASGPDALDKGYFDSVFGDTKILGSTFINAWSALAPESRNIGSYTSRLLLDNVASRQPLRDAMAANVKNFRHVARQGAKQPTLKSDIIDTSAQRISR